ncbi:MAG: hypothetical protein ABI702_24750 [Burkholderiales bacterium]
MPADGIRFFIYVRWAQLKQDSASHSELDQMVARYIETYWAVDPMHPSRFEDSDTAVISNPMVMSDAEWRASEIFVGIYQPNGYAHSCDVFFQQQGRIVAVLSLVRRVRPTLSRQPRSPGSNRCSRSCSTASARSMYRAGRIAAPAWPCSFA